MLSKQIEKAQKKVEEQYFLMRKHTLEYDDVLNQQREVIYTYRDEILEGRDMSDAAREEIVEPDRAAGRASTRPATSSRTGTSRACCARIEEIFTPERRAAVDSIPIASIARS